MFIDALYESLLAGGWVLVPIFLVGTYAFYLLIRMVYRLGADLYSRHFDEEISELIVVLQDRDTSELDRLGNTYRSKSGLLHKVLLILLESRNEAEEAREVLLKAEVTQVYTKMDEGMQMVGVLAAVAPLLGLLGTVTGMVSTFDIITLYGNSNPVLMAGGISEALITTQSGLLIAFPVVLWKNRIQDRLDWVQKQIELCVVRVLNAKETEGESI
jgi:biopolymer transport protein ExbB